MSEHLTQIPDELSRTPEAKKAMQAGPTAYHEFLDGLNSRIDAGEDIFTPSTETPVDPVIDPPIDDPVVDPQDTAPVDAGPLDEPTPVLDEADFAVLKKYKIVDEKGQFLSKYKDSDQMLAAIGAKDKAISSKFGDFIKSNPDAARELLTDVGAIDQATPEVQAPVVTAPAEDQVDRVAEVLSTYPTPEAALAEEYKAELEEIGMAVPKTAKEWRDLADISPGLHAEMREALRDKTQQFNEVEQVLRQAAQMRQQREASIPAFEEKLIDEERKALREQGIPDFLIDKAIEEVKALRKSKTEVDEVYYHDRDDFGNRIYAPVLKPGAIGFHLRNVHFTEVIDAVAEAKATGQRAARLEHAAKKVAKAGLFPASVAGRPGVGREDRRGAVGPRPTEEQYANAEWRMQNLKTQEQRDAARRYIESQRRGR